MSTLEKLSKETIKYFIERIDKWKTARGLNADYKENRNSLIKVSKLKNASHKQCC